MKHFFVNGISKNVFFIKNRFFTVFLASVFTVCAFFHLSPVSFKGNVALRFQVIISTVATSLGGTLAPFKFSRHTIL
jgi:hypothetical protein